MMAVKSYRRKPEEIKAVQYTGLNFEEVKEFLGEVFYSHYVERRPDGRNEITIASPEHGGRQGGYVAKVGDWIVKDTNGIFRTIHLYAFDDQYIEIDYGASGYKPV